MPRFTLREEIAASFAAILCSAIFVLSAVGPATGGAAASFI